MESYAKAAGGAADGAAGDTADSAAEVELDDTADGAADGTADGTVVHGVFSHKSFENARTAMIQVKCDDSTLLVAVT